MTNSTPLQVDTPADDLHGHAEAVASRPTPAYYHLNGAHHGRDVRCAAIPPSLSRKKAAHAPRPCQWYCTNDLCSKNPSANSLAPANATQTGESSSLAARNQLIPERSGSNSIYCIIFIRIWTPPPSRRPYVDVSQLYISVCRRSSMLLFKLPIGGRNWKEIISTLEAAASVTASAAGASARLGCVLG